MAGVVSVNICLPRRLYERLARRARELGLDVESLILDMLIDRARMDEWGELEARLELAWRYLEEAKKASERDPVQASEKLCRAAEEAVKALVLRHQLRDVLCRVRERGRWLPEDLFKAVSRLKSVYGEELRRLWSTAWELRAWGSTKAKATRNYVEERLRDVERLVELAANPPRRGDPDP